jgi:hypothetical protein
MAIGENARGLARGSLFGGSRPVATATLCASGALGALLPAAACTVGIAAAVSMLNPGAHDWTALDVTALLLFLQIGYLGGAGLRMFVRLPRMVSERKRLPSSWVIRNPKAARPRSHG